MASFEIEWKASTKKDLRKIPPGVVRKVVDMASSLGEDPFPEGVAKLRGSEQSYRVRVGNYRIVYEVFADRKVIEIQRVRDRKDVYRK